MTMIMTRRGTTSHYRNGNIVKGYSYDIHVSEGRGINIEAVLWPDEIVLYPKIHSESNSGDFEIDITGKAYHFTPEKISKFFRWAQTQNSIDDEFKAELREILTKVKREYVRKFGEIF